MITTYYLPLRINPRVCFFDKVALRMARPLTEKQMNYLRENCSYADARSGRPIRGSDKALILTVVNPNKAALEFLANRPDALLNTLEVALDFITTSYPEAVRMRDLFDRAFVHAWHGRKQVRQIRASTYTDSRRGRTAGRQFTWYSDRGSKRTGDPYCFHVEGRHQGVAACRRVGVNGVADLLTFDHQAYWARHMNLYLIDFEVLGRFHENRRTGRRRQRARIDQIGPLAYNCDRRTGQTLFRVFGQLPEGPDDKLAPFPDRERLSVQMLIDRYGRGPFLKRMDATDLIPKRGTSLYCYMQQSL